MAEYDPMRLAAALDRSAKRWWSTTLLLKVAGFGVGALAVFVETMSPSIPYWVASLAVAAELCGYRMDGLKGNAQALRRKLEYLDGLDWKITPPELTDLLAGVPSSVKAESLSEPIPGPYFASTAPPGTRRLLENLSESAWFSKHLARTMAKSCTVVVTLAVGVAIVALLVALESAAPPASTAVTARVVTALLMLVVTAGLVRLAPSHFAFAGASENAERAADAMRAKPAPELVEAVKALHEYQVARAGAPLIPEWVWNLRRATLNELWQQYRRGD